MRRETSQPRENWLEKVEGEGLTYAVDRGETGNPRNYWNESAAYVLTVDEADELADTSEELHEMACQAARLMVQDESTLSRHGFPEWVAPALQQSLETETLTLYGRFDLAYDGTGPAKLLEYNADTPAGLVEAAVTQWYWLEDVHPDKDQWNLLHENLVKTFKKVPAPNRYVHFAVGQNEPTEDWATAAYLRDTAREAGLQDYGVTMEDIGWDSALERFVDLEGLPIDVIYKMYPWEWMLEEDFGRQAVETNSTRWLEPVWKTLLSSKALLPIMWDLNPGHPNLLPSYFDHPHGMEEYVSKPVYGWEGAGIEIVTRSRSEVGKTAHTAGQERIYQQYTPLPSFDGNLPVIGSWIIGGKPAGIGIRESDNLVTDTNARFVPHYLDAPRSTPQQIAELLKDSDDD